MYRNCKTIKLNKVELQGSWILVGASMEANDVSKRIEILTSDYLVEITEDESGWNKLYQDPEDKRYWELSYPESERHGGGAPLLKNLPLEDVKEKYRI